MPSGIAREFATRLQELERTRSIDSLLQIFADNVELRRAPQHDSYAGLDGARRFWREYLDTFEAVETEFDRITEDETRAALEWHSHGKRHGTKVRYEGCTVIERDGDRVVNLRTYYDSGAVLGHRRSHG